MARDPLLARLMKFDFAAIAELNQLAATDPRRCFAVGWKFITKIADHADHVPAGTVDASIIAMQKALGPAHLEDKLLAAWLSLSERCRDEISYVGTANPRALSNEFCERLFYSPVTSLGERICIVASLASTRAERDYPVSRLAQIIDDLAGLDPGNAKLAGNVKHLREFL